MHRIVLYPYWCFLLCSITGGGVSGFVTRRHHRYHHQKPRITAFSKRNLRRQQLQLTPFPDFTISQETIESSKTLFHHYESLLASYPLETKAVTSGILATVGDAIAQVGTRDKDKPFQYDPLRGLVYLGFGALYTGAFQHFWFQFLGSHVCQWGEAINIWGPSRAAIPVEDVYGLNEWWSYFDVVSVLESPPSNAAVATAKLAVNQFLIVPTVYMPLFFALTGSLATLDYQGSLDRAKEKYIPILIRNYSYWLPMQFIQFLVIPQEWQILYISLASVLWTVILSSLATEQSATSQEAANTIDATTAATNTDSVTATTLATDNVSLEDVGETLIPQAARDVLINPKFGLTTVGGFVALLTSAANDGLVGSFVSNLLGATVGSGVALTTAMGAFIGLLSASKQSLEEIGTPEEQMMKQVNEGKRKYQSQQQREEQLLLKGRASEMVQ